MTKPQDSKAKPASGSNAAVGRLYVLDIGGGIIFTVNPDGSNYPSDRLEQTRVAAALRRR